MSELLTVLLFVLVLAVLFYFALYYGLESL